MDSPNDFEKLQKQISHTFRIVLPDDSRIRIRALLLGEISATGSGERTRAWYAHFFEFTAFPRAAFQAAIIAVLIVSSIGSVVAADAAKPGDTLFPVKKAVEQLHLALAMDPVYKAKVAADIAAERMQELVELTVVATKTVTLPTPSSFFPSPQPNQGADVSNTPRPLSTSLPLTAVLPLTATSVASSSLPLITEAAIEPAVKENLIKASQETKAALDTALSLLEGAGQAVEQSPDEEKKQLVENTKIVLSAQVTAHLPEVKLAKDALTKEPNKEANKEVVVKIEEVEKTIEEKILKKKEPSKASPAPSEIPKKPTTTTPILQPKRIFRKPSPVPSLLPLPTVSPLTESPVPAPSSAPPHHVSE